MKTGIVMQLSAGEAVVLSAAGQFVKVKAQPEWKVGETVVFKKVQLRSQVWVQFLAIAACFALLVGLGLGGIHQFNKTTSIISIDINPSMELELNRFGKVVSAVGYNADGKEVLGQMNLKGLSYKDAVQTIVQSPQMAPYFKQKEYIVFSVYSDSQADQVLAFLEETANGLVSDYPQMQASCEQVDGEVLQQAHMYGITSGKMKTIMQLQELDPTATVEEYETSELCDIHQSIENCRHGLGRNGEGGQSHHGNTNSDTQNGQWQQGNQGVTSQAGQSSQGGNGQQGQNPQGGYGGQGQNQQGTPSQPVQNNPQGGGYGGQGQNQQGTPSQSVQNPQGGQGQQGQNQQDGYGQNGNGWSGQEHHQEHYQDPENCNW